MLASDAATGTLPASMHALLVAALAHAASPRTSLTLALDQVAPHTVPGTHPALQIRRGVHVYGLQITPENTTVYSGGWMLIATEARLEVTCVTEGHSAVPASRH